MFRLLTRAAMVTLAAIMLAAPALAQPDSADCQNQPLSVSDIVVALRGYTTCDSFLTESCVALIDCNGDGETMTLADFVCMMRAFTGECSQIFPGPILPVPWPFDCWVENPYADTIEVRLVNQPGQLTLTLSGDVAIRGLAVWMAVDGEITFEEPIGPDPDWPMVLVDCGQEARFYAVDDTFEGTGILPGEFAEVHIAYSGSGSVALTMVEAADPVATPLAVRVLESVLPGDVSEDGATNIVDVTRIIDYVFRSGDPVNPLLGDVTHDCAIDVLDVTDLIDYVFRSGDYPHVGCVE